MNHPNDSARKSYIALNLGMREPNFDDRCVVCNEPCERSDRVLLKAWSANALPGADFVPTRDFLIPAHISSRKCARHLRWRWWLAAYGAIVVLTVVGIVALALTLSLHKGMPYWYEIMIPTLAFVIALYLWSINSLAISIQQRVREGEYLFRFRNTEYAESFKGLNAQYLKR